MRPEEEGVKIPEAGAELRDDKLYPTIRALVDGGDVYKIVLYRLKKGVRYLYFYVRGDAAAARAVKLGRY